MSIGKAFGISLVTFLGLNMGFFVLYYLLDGTLVTRFTQIASDPYIIFEFVGFAMFNCLSVSMGPSFPFTSIVTLSFSGISDVMTFLTNLVLFIGLIVPPLIASVIAGIFVSDRKEGALSWFLTSMIMAIIAFMGFLLIFIAGSITLMTLIRLLVVALVLGVMFTAFYGFVTLITRRSFPY